MKLVSPHSKTSREVTDADVPKLDALALVMHALCLTPHGCHDGGYAVAHSQIDDQDPMRFFVTKELEVIVNPRVTGSTKVPCQKREGCLTFPDRQGTVVPRFNKLTVEYWKFKEGRLEGPITEDLKGLRAQIFQHEIDHMNAKYIFDK